MKWGTCVQVNGEIRLREIREDDFLFFYSMYSNPEVMRYTLVNACARMEEYRPYFQKSMRDAAALVRVRFEYVAELPDGTRIGMGDIDQAYVQQAREGGDRLHVVARVLGERVCHAHRPMVAFGRFYGYAAGAGDRALQCIQRRLRKGHAKVRHEARIRG